MDLKNLRAVSISNRLHIGLGLIIAFMAVLTLTGVWGLGTMNGKLERIVQVNERKIELAQNIRTAIGEVEKSFMATLLMKDESETKKEQQNTEEARAAYASALASLEKLENTENGKGIIADIKNNFEVAQGALARALELSTTGGGQQSSTLTASARAVIAQSAKSAEEMVAYQQGRADMRAKEARATYVKTRYFLLILGAAVFVFAIFLSSFLAKSITGPLSEGVLVAQKIAAGDLTAHIGATAKDEVGQLLAAMKNMIENLQRIIGEVKAASGNMTAASQQLNSSSELMSKNAGDQAGRASQVATASEEISQTILDVAKNTSSIETSATGTVKLARDGEGVVERSVEKVKAIAKTVADSAEMIKLLGERSNQIGAIINVINEIADQTNLLALNAAIEAARAGDAGRGFAVVADEVRKLAERTGSSTSEIGGMIKAIQGEVHQAVLSMDNITNEVKTGVDLSAQTGNVLRGIIEAVEQLHLMVQQIASATEEMASTSDEINKDIERIAGSSRETSGSSEHIAKASQELSRLSTGLEQVVGGFRI
jgi:methyl-accepting chemotaxis protein